jgi:hypothetical protein
MVFNWGETHSVRYDTTSHHLSHGHYCIRIDFNETTEEVYLIIYDPVTKPNKPVIVEKNSSFLSVESAKCWVERWVKLDLLV